MKVKIEIAQKSIEVKVQDLKVIVEIWGNCEELAFYLEEYEVSLLRQVLSLAENALRAERSQNQ